MSGSLTVASSAERRETLAERRDGSSVDVATPRRLSARLEPFDSYWQAPEDVESGYASFSAYYRANYLSHLPEDRNARILVISCGPGYLVNLLVRSGYHNVLGIDSDAAKIGHARRRGLNCEVAEAF